MRTLGFLVTGVMTAAIVACASGNGTSSQGSDLTESSDAAVTTDGGSAATDAAAPSGDASIDPAADASAPTVPSYDDVAPIVQASCAGCHDDQFATLDAIKENGPSMLILINKGRMPKGDPTFKTSPDGQKLVTYLTSSPDLQP